MKPGDVIEWVYEDNGKIVHENELLWSSTGRGWIPIGKPALLISITEETYTWLSEKGLFHAHVDDTRRGWPQYRGAGVVPRARG